MRYWIPPGGLGGSDDYVLNSDYTDLAVLGKIKNVDGAGSGLDADLLDGNDSTAFATAGHTHANLNQYIVGAQVSGSPNAGQYCLMHLLPIEIALDIADTGCAASCKTRATASTVFEMKYVRPSDGYSVSLGTITFTAASNSGSIGSVGSRNIPAGRYLQIQAPDPADATLADLSFTFIGAKI